MFLEQRTQQDRVDLFKMFVKLPIEQKRKTLRWLLLDETKNLDFTAAIQNRAEQILRGSEEACIAEFKYKVCKHIDYIRDGGIFRRNELIEKFHFYFEDEQFNELAAARY